MDIRLELTPNDAIVDVRDYGQGIAREMLGNFQVNGIGAGMGLAGIPERVGEFGGRLEITAASPGTRVRASIPMPHELRSHSHL